jgi:protein gp37
MASDHSAIEWTEATWNPTSGCTKVSPGCDRCYAERITARFPNTFPNGFALTARPQSLEIPLHWRRRRTIFVNSMSDLFHKDVPEEYIQRVFDVMVRTPQHTYQVLTKRAERLARMAPRLPWPAHVWMGVSVESPAYTWRLDYLRRVGAAVRFISAEPLLAPLPKPADVLIRKFTVGPFDLRFVHRSFRPKMTTGATRGARCTTVALDSQKLVGMTVVASL